MGKLVVQSDWKEAVNVDNQFWVSYRAGGSTTSVHSHVKRVKNNQGQLTLVAEDLRFTARIDADQVIYESLTNGG